MPAFNGWRNGHHPLWGKVAKSLTQQKMRVPELTRDHTPPSIVPWCRVELVSQNCIPESLCWAPWIQSEHDRRVPPGTGTQTGRQFGVGRQRGLVKMSGVEPGSAEDRGFPGGVSGQESACQCRRRESCGFDPWVGKIPRRRQWQPTLVFLPGKFHGQTSLAGCNPWGHRVGHD